MITKVSLSQLQALGYTIETFTEAVESYRQARVDHSQTLGQPAPTAKYHGIEQCVMRIPPDAENDEKFEASFEIVNDLPPPPQPPTLQDKKTAHVAAAHALFEKVINDAIPILKRRSWSLAYMDINSKPEEERTADEKVFHRQHEGRIKFEQTAQRHLGKLESQIHDLTDTTVDAWKPEPFDILF
jgi:hypothetical protein